jgi:LuxR family glucitol operon transcriptional activator
VPLAIVWSIGLMGLGGSVESVLHRLGSGQSDITKFCFEESARQIHGKDAHVLLMSLTLFSSDASREALGMVAGLGQDEFGRDTGLEELLRLSLVNKTGERFSLLPLTANFAKAETARYLPWFTEARTRWHNYFFAVSYEIGEDTRRRRDANRIERDLANMIAVIEDVAARLQYRQTPEGEQAIADESILRARELIVFCDPVAHTCYERGYWSECERICSLAIRLCRMVHYQAMLGWRYYNLCRIYLQRSEFDAAEIAIQEVLSAWSSAGNSDWISHSYRILASILQFRGQTDAAEEHYQRAIAGYQASSNPDMAIYVHTTSASLDELRGDLASAMRRYREILEILRQENRQGFLTSIHYRLGQLTLADGDLASARVHLSEGLQIAQERHFASMTARYLYQLAELERAQGQNEAAAAAMHDALAMFRRLGLRREQDQGEALLAQLGANL